MKFNVFQIPNDRQIDIIVGSMLGDASLSKPKKKHHNSFLLSHIVMNRLNICYG